MELSEYIHGALFLEKTPDGVLPRRFTDEQLTFYRENTDFAAKALATACVRLEFITDADRFSFHYVAVPASSRRYCYIDAAVDGVPVAHTGTEFSERYEGDFSLSLPGNGRHRVTVYLPNLFSMRLSELSIPQGAVLKPVIKKRRALILGDSITQGYDARFPSQSYANLIADRFDAEAINQGIGGEIFHPEALAPIPFRPDFITVAYGTNDFFRRDYDKAVVTAAAYFQKLRALFPEVTVFALTPIWRADAEKSKRIYPGGFASVSELIKKAVDGIGNSFVIDGDKLTPHLTQIFFDGYLHPNDFGYKFYAENLALALSPYLEK